MKRSKLKTDSVMSAEDRALMDRLQAKPAPAWVAAIAAHAARTRKANAEWNAIINAAPALSAEDAATLARLEAMPAPHWLAPMLAYKTHAQRMAVWFKELDTFSRPLTWRPIPAERAELIAAHYWPDKRRDEVKRIAAARGDTFPQALQLSA